MEFHLLVDDLKDLNIENVARTFADGKKAMIQNRVTHLYIDHDLGEEMSGYDLIVWAIESNRLPPFVQIVSHNPVGRQNIERALENQGYVKKGVNWTKN